MSVCPECGYPVQDEDEFCNKCAEKLGPPTDWKAAYSEMLAQYGQLREFVVDLSEGWVGNVQARAQDVLDGGWR